jgi:hypothetical protein
MWSSTGCARSGVAFFRADRRVRPKTCPILFHCFRRTFAKERAQIETDIANVADNLSYSSGRSLTVMRIVRPDFSFVAFI